MPSLLHILTRPDDALAREIIARQQSNLENKVVVADLTQAQPDYGELLERIFAAEKIISW